jgi:serine/threonine-protein kinase
MLPPVSPKDASPFAAGQVFSHYKLVRRLGRGGFGEVWEAVDQRFWRKVAVKFLLPKYKDDKKAIKRFKAEAIFSTLLTHASIVALLDTGQREDGAYYHVMEFLDGKLLSVLLEETDAKQATIGMPRAAHIAWQIAIVLHALHKRNIIHRDLKPHNLMLMSDPLVPDGLRVKILDFGIAKLNDEEAAQELELGQETTAGAHLGSPIIMAREQWRTGEPLTPAVDVYALGCILYKMLAGTYPFEGTPNVLRIHHELIDPTPLVEEVPSVPPAISQLVQGMLAKEPEKRPSMATVVDELGRILNLSTAAAGPIVTRPTGEMNALMAELATGSSGPATASGLAATQAPPAAGKPTDPEPQSHTSARHGQQVTGEETRARRQQRRRWLSVAAVGLLIGVSGLATWRILLAEHPATIRPIPTRKPAAENLPASDPATQQAPANKPPAVATPQESGAPANHLGKEAPAALPEAKTRHGKSKGTCTPVELSAACVHGALTDAQKAKTVSALHDAMNNTKEAINPKVPIRFCDSSFLVISGDYQIRSAKGVRRETRDNFASALRAFLRLPSLPGEIQIRCQAK